MARNLKAKIKLEADTKQADRALKGTSANLGKTGKEVDSLGSRFGKLQAGLLAAVAAFGGIIAVVKSAIAAFVEQENAVNKLDASLASLGDEGEALSKRLQQLASELQSVSNFGDEVTISALAQITAFTKDEAAIEGLIKASADLAAGQGISLASAASLVGRSFATSTNALTRQGVELDAVAGSTDRLFQLTQAVADLYGGQATAAANTFSGAQTRLSNALGDSSENFAKVVIEATEAERLLRVLGATVEKLNEDEEEAVEEAGFFSKALGFVGAAAERLIPAINIVRQATILYKLSLDAAEKQLGITNDEFKGLTGSVLVTSVAFKDATAVLQRYADLLGITLPDSISDAKAELKALGTVFEQDVNKEIQRNNFLLEQADELYRNGTITLDSYTSAQNAVARANEALRNGFENSIKTTDDLSTSLEGAVLQTGRLVDAENRLTQTVVAGAQARNAARASESRFSQNAITGGQSTFATIRPITFYEAPPVQFEPNGLVKAG